MLSTSFSTTELVVIALISAQEQQQDRKNRRSFRIHDFLRKWRTGVDFSEKTKRERRLLVPFLIQARKMGKLAFLKQNSLVINNITYTSNDLKHKDINDLIMNKAIKKTSVL
ncbi:hypothetical protein JTB14_033154 [Gonioctena quinquepunctata]|nr:hypothetical protein JTB14_033154 [Gonioctena quinquepunctata]